MAARTVSPFADVFVVDADSHWSEPPDLFTSIAPPQFKDRVPRVEEDDGEATWVFDGHPVGRHGAGGVIARDGANAPETRKKILGENARALYRL